MSLLESIVLGFVQGITEFLPVSSYGQLLLLKNMLGVSNAGNHFFEIFLHMGTAIAISIVFRKDIKRIYQAMLQMLPTVFYNIKTYCYNLLHEEEEREYQQIMKNNYQKFAGMLLVSILCCITTGYLCSRFAIRVSDSLMSVGLNFFITAVILLVVDLWKCGTTIPDDMKFWQAILIGVCHGLGIFPGISSLGITISVCLLCGLRRYFAVRYAFLLCIPMNLGAFIFGVCRFEISQPVFSNLCIYALGMLCSMMVSLLGARWLLRFLTKRRLRLFAIYSFVVGIFAIVFHFM